MKNFFTFKYFKGNLFGGLTAGIVALPLALAFGEQSGLGAGAGLYGAAFLAFFAALFGGTSTQISGPTAPMTALSMVLVGGVLQNFEGNIERALPIILAVFLLAGIFQILLGVIKAGSFIKYIPSTVVSGFMTGIGVIILITQILPAIGYYSGTDPEVVERFKPHAEELILDRILAEEAQDGILVLEEFKETISRSEQITQEEIHTEAVLLATNASKGVNGSINYLLNGFRSINTTELLICLITIVIIYGFKKITTIIPSALVALFVVSGGAYFLQLDYLLIKEIPGGYPVFYSSIFSEFSISSMAPYFVTALLLALLGAIDSLLTSVVADNMTKTKHNSNKELIGQGIGNSLASMFGGIPGAGATIRTVVNIQSGGKTKLSGMIAGLLLFAMVISLGPLASKIPAAVLAGILITVGIGVMDYKGLKAFPKMENSEKAIFLVVLLLTVFWQLVYAVGIGLVMAAFVFMKRMGDMTASEATVCSLDDHKEHDASWLEELEVSKEIREKVIFKDLRGPLFFGFVSEFKEMLSHVPDAKLVVIRMEKVPFMDQSGVNALIQVLEDLAQKDVILAISGPVPQVRETLENMEIVPQMIPASQVFETFIDCQQWLSQVLNAQNPRLEATTPA